MSERVVMEVKIMGSLCAVSLLMDVKEQFLTVALVLLKFSTVWQPAA